MKDQALWLYRQLTARSRTRLLETLREDGNIPIAILFYHRVSDVHPNEWTISTADFARHLDWLQENFEIVSLSRAQEMIRAPKNEKPVVAITFDDGYSDNSTFAIPELARRGIPATYFVTTDFVRTGRPFPHDLRADVPLQPNTFDELRQYLEMGIEIGAHTRNHADIGQCVNETELRDEILGSIHDLQTWLHKPIDYFAFPFGLPHNITQLAVDILHEAGVKGFCSAYGAWNWPGSPGFHLRRIHGDPGMARLQNWLTYDARKLADSQQLPFSEPNEKELELTTLLLDE
ncbi:MAG TPA: xylanase [Planctomycetaceae bacterium]|nr:xylanase [Planctomycetaceae bacterium]